MTRLHTPRRSGARVRPVFFMTVIALAGIATACGDDSASSSPTSTLPPVTAPPTTAAPAPDGAWVATGGTIGGTAVRLVPDADITLDIDGDQIGGTSACNHYGGAATFTAGTMTIGDVSATEMACTATGVMDLEAAYLGSLADGTYAIDGDTLTLTMGDAVWTFTRAA